MQLKKKKKKVFKILVKKNHLVNRKEMVVGIKIEREMDYGFKSSLELSEIFPGKNVITRMV
jgi:hypothetical protein